jgi:type IV pilus assembly protein PilM
MKKFQFFSPFKKKKQKKKIKIGLDWGFSSLKVVILESEDDTYLLKDAKIIQLPSRDLNLSSLVKNLDLSGGVTLGICGPNVVVRYVSMAKMSWEEFKNSLRYEAASHLPFPVEESNLDGVILKDLPDNQMLVMLAAAKKDFINKRLELFQEAGISVNILDIDSLALINAFNYTHPLVQDGAVALLNIGASVTNINILEDGVPHFTRDINVAGKDFSREGSRDIAIADFVSEIRKSFDYYEAGSSAVINKIFLSGGGSLISGLVTSIESILGIHIEQWEAFSNFKFAPTLDEASIRKNSSQFAVAIGLALR